MFNVGDLVIGNNNNCYAITKKGAICLVLKNLDAPGGMVVCVIADNINEYNDSLDINPKNHLNDDSFSVLADKFDLFTGGSSNCTLTGLYFRKDIKKLVSLKAKYVGTLNVDKYIYIGEL